MMRAHRSALPRVGTCWVQLPLRLASGHDATRQTEGTWPQASLKCSRKSASVASSGNPLTKTRPIPCKKRRCRRHGRRTRNNLLFSRIKRNTCLRHAPSGPVSSSPRSLLTSPSATLSHAACAVSDCAAPLRACQPNNRRPSRASALSSSALLLRHALGRLTTTAAAATSCCGATSCRRRRTARVPRRCDIRPVRKGASPGDDTGLVGGGAGPLLDQQLARVQNIS